MFKSKKLAPARVYLWRTFVSFIISFAFLALSLGFGIWGYHHYAGLPLIDSLLNASMILTGMGPIDPMTTDAAKLFASFYSIYSGVAFLTSIGVFIAPTLHRLLHKFHIEDTE
ncbi:MAG: hypothetical protein ACTHJT_02185 [Cytophaga sp.]|uniref:hypothetical protein n=1 Tax=Cytophaga sp. TaxID=29535 RepID=UPI003F7F5EE9